MATSDGYGQRLAERLRVESAPAIVTRALRKADIAVTEIRCDDPLPGMTGSIQREDAFLVGLQLRDFTPSRTPTLTGRPPNIPTTAASAALSARLSTVLSDAGRSGREIYLLGLLKTATTPTTHRKIFCTDPRTVAGFELLVREVKGQHRAS